MILLACIALKWYAKRAMGIWGMCLTTDHKTKAASDTASIPALWILRKNNNPEISRNTKAPHMWSAFFDFENALKALRADLAGFLVHDDLIERAQAD